MEKYLVVLKNMNGEPDWLHPSELNAVSKAAAKAMILQNTDEQYIAGVFTINEYNGVYQQVVSGRSDIRLPMKQQTENAGEFPEDGNAFLECMISMATAQAERNTNKSAVSVPSAAQQEPTVPVQNTATIPQNVITSQDNQQVPASFFTDNGIDYKIENNILYKKDWENVNSETCINFRIINSVSGRPIKNEKYVIQQLTWIPVKQN